MIFFLPLLHSLQWRLTGNKVESLKVVSCFKEYKEAFSVNMSDTVSEKDKKDFNYTFTKIYKN